MMDFLLSVSAYKRVHFYGYIEWIRSFTQQFVEQKSITGLTINFPYSPVFCKIYDEVVISV